MLKDPGGSGGEGGMEEGLGGSKWRREAGLTQTPFALVTTWIFMPGAKGNGEGNGWWRHDRISSLKTITLAFG